MKIGWLVKSVGIFGSIRGMLEISNSLIRRGHEVTIYYQHGLPCTWLPNECQYGRPKELADAPLNILIGLFDSEAALYETFCQARAPVKALAIVGFTPSEELAQQLRGEHAPANEKNAQWCDALQRGFRMISRALWESRWMEDNLGIRVGADYGGINLKQFCRLDMKRSTPPPWLLIATGDPRERKGMPMVQAAWDLLEKQEAPIETEMYWGRFDQEGLVEFLNRGRVFCDGHKDGGWCNPVIEAMACGTPVVCTRTPCTSDFAFDEQTALTVPAGDAEAMATAIQRLMNDEQLRLRITRQATETVQMFDYERVVIPFEAELQRFIEEAQC